MRYAIALLALLAFGSAVPTAGASVDSTSCNVELLSNVSPSANGYIDCWGFVGRNGDEYAVIHENAGTYIFRVTDPANPVQTGFFPGTFTFWRDSKFYNDYLYIVADGGVTDGLQIIDVFDPDNPFQLPSYTDFNSAHNIYLDSTTARLYVLGSNKGAGGVRILDIGTDPENPVEIGSWETDYCHDFYVRNDTGYVASVYSKQFYVLDMSNPASISQLAVHNYNKSCHSTWLLSDSRYLLTTDEENRGRIRCWDIGDLTNVSQISAYRPDGADLTTTVHNVFVKNDTAYVSHYKYGFRVVDFTDPYDPVEIGFYDTYPAPAAQLFVGSFGVYPYLPSGTIVMSDMQTGLWLFRYDDSSVSVGVDGPASIPARFSLAQNAPNPFNPSTKIRYALDRAADVTLLVYDVTGREVRTDRLGVRSAGEHTLDFRAQDLASGAYFYRILVDGVASESKSMTLIR